MTLLIIYASVAIGVSFVCSILEAVLLSITPTFIEQISERRPKQSALLRGLKSRISQPLSAILILNTIAHTAGAAGVGAEAKRLWGEDSLAVAAAVLTVLVVVVSEIIPKTIGALFWKKLAVISAQVLRLMVWVLYPFVWLSEVLMNALKSKHHGPSISRDEIAALARLGTSQGVFAESESRVINNLLRFGSTRTREIMTPRTVVAFLRAEQTVGEAITDEGLAKYSRLPVFEQKRDNVVGYVLKTEVLLRAAKDDLATPVRDLIRPFQTVQDTTPVSELFETLLNTREQIALVVDEYGGVDGVVTMEDLIETLLGREIVDEADTEADLREVAKAKWQARAKQLESERPPPRQPGGASEPPE